MEFLIAEFSADFDKHADVLQFFRSLDVHNTYFVKNVAFGKELIRLQDIEKKLSHPVAALSVAYGPDEPLPLPTPRDETPPPIPQAPMYLDLKPIRPLDTTAASASESLIPIDTPNSGSAASSDWRWMCQDIESDESDGESPQPIGDVSASDANQEVKRNTKKTKQKYVSQKKDSGELKTTCQLCQKTMINKASYLTVHSFSHVDKTFGCVYSCDRCEMNTNVYEKIKAHARERKHTYTNRSTNADNTELIGEIERVFERCFPGGELTVSLIRVIQTMERGGRVEDWSPTDKKKCAMCEVWVMRRPDYLLTHSNTHLHASFGDLFTCNDCHFADCRLKTIQHHSSSNDHSYTNRATDPRNFELVEESARLFGVCFPGCTPPLKLDKAVSGARRLRGETAHSAPSAKRQLSPAGPPHKRQRIEAAMSVECQRCHITLHPASATLTPYQLAKHARMHVNEEGGGKRYQCAGCGEQRSGVQPRSHFNTTDHVAVDRMQTDSKYASMCDRVFGECFPGRPMPGEKTSLSDERQPTPRRPPPFKHTTAEEEGDMYID